MSWTAFDAGDGRPEGNWAAGLYETSREPHDGGVNASPTSSAESPQAPPVASPGAQVVLLGTGTPPADPDRSGPATAIVVNGTPYLVDFGAGVVRRAKSAVVDKGISALDPINLRVVFVTYLHSDHTVGYPDLILTPWVLGRRVPLEVYGPSGIKAMSDHVLEAYRADFETRMKDRRLYSRVVPEAHAVNAHEVRAGMVYKDPNVTVTAFPTKHAMESYGYRFDASDRSVVISGDTSPTQATIDACNGCDVTQYGPLSPHGVSPTVARRASRRGIM